MKGKTMFKALALATLFVSHSVCAEEIVNSEDIVLVGLTNITVAAGVTNVYSGVISGSGPIAKTGPGRLVLPAKMFLREAQSTLRGMSEV